MITKKEMIFRNKKISFTKFKIFITTMIISIIAILAIPSYGYTDSYGLSFQIVEVAKGDTYGQTPITSSYDNYWLKAKTYCENKGLSLPTKEQLEEIAQKLYVDNVYCPGVTKIPDINDTFKCSINLKSDPLWIALAGTGKYNSWFALWSNQPDGNTAGYGRYFDISYSGYTSQAAFWSNWDALCVK